MEIKRFKFVKSGGNQLDHLMIHKQIGSLVYRFFNAMKNFVLIQYTTSKLTNGKEIKHSKEIRFVWFFRRNFVPFF